MGEGAGGEGGGGRWEQRSRSPAETTLNLLTEPDVFSPSLVAAAIRVFLDDPPPRPLSLTLPPLLRLSLDGVSQRLLLDATYASCFSKVLSAPRLRPHLPMLLLHKH